MISYIQSASFTEPISNKLVYTFYIPCVSTRIEPCKDFKIPYAGQSFSDCAHGSYVPTNSLLSQICTYVTVYGR